eukprot:1160261-Pelagomonas_calceolata.AAC.17
MTHKVPVGSAVIVLPGSPLRQSFPVQYAWVQFARNPLLFVGPPAEGPQRATLRHCKQPCTFRVPSGQRCGIRGPSGQRSGSAVAMLKAMRAYGLDSLLREVMLTPHQLAENLAEPDAPPHSVCGHV